MKHLIVLVLGGMFVSPVTHAQSFPDEARMMLCQTVGDFGAMSYDAKVSRIKRPVFEAPDSLNVYERVKVREAFRFAIDYGYEEAKSRYQARSRSKAECMSLIK